MKKLVYIFIIINLFWSCSEKISSKTEFQFVKIPIESDLYFYTNSGGLLGSVEEINFVSDTMNLKENKLTFFCYEIYYKIENRKIIIFAPNSSVKDEEINSQKELIEFKSLVNKTEIDKISKDYKKMNLEKISIYDN